MVAILTQMQTGSTIVMRKRTSLDMDAHANPTTARNPNSRMFYGWMMVFGIFLMVVISEGV
jgi:hypothetical protein